MTFIASVIAKKGVAIIADSLVTSQMPILDYKSFIEYLEGKPDNEKGEKSIDPEEILALFSHQPSFTKDYQEKLFKLDTYGAITTTGIAYINGKEISDLVEEFKALNTSLDSAPMEDKCALFRSFLNEHIREHLKSHETIGYCLFMLTFYEKHTHKTHIFNISINEQGQDRLADGKYDFTVINKAPDFTIVVCDGQNKISENVLYGFGKELFLRFNSIVSKILATLPLPKGFKKAEFISKLTEDQYFTDIFYDAEIFNLSSLSLQQAVDLASLLMRLEVDFQKYTKNIPTVGGVIKLAVIDENGFSFIAGDKVEPPKHIHI